MTVVISVDIFAYIIYEIRYAGNAVFINGLIIIPKFIVKFACTQIKFKALNFIVTKEINYFAVISRNGIFILIRKQKYRANKQNRN